MGFLRSMVGMGFDELGCEADECPAETQEGVGSMPVAGLMFVWSPSANICSGSEIQKMEVLKSTVYFFYTIHFY